MADGPEFVLRGVTRGVIKRLHFSGTQTNTGQTQSSKNDMSAPLVSPEAFTARDSFSSGK